MGRKAVVTVLVSTFLVAVGAYGTADTFDKVPGILTTKPPVSDPQRLPAFKPLRLAKVTFSKPQETPVDAQKVAAILNTLKTDVDTVNATAASGNNGTKPPEKKEGEGALPPPPSPNPAATPAKISALVRADGKDLGAINPKETLVPASSTKLVAAATALKILGPNYRFPTYTTYSDGTLNLIGEGDMLLSSGKGQARLTNGHAGLGDLAAATAAKLKKEKVGSVRLNIDTTYYGKPDTHPDWTEEGNTEFVGKIVPLAIDTGRIDGTQYRYYDDPVQVVATEFAHRLTEAGITVSETTQSKAKEGERLASVQSAPLAAVIHETLKDSDNTLAEGICHAAAAKAGQPATFAGADKVVQSVIANLKIPRAEVANRDCSGLSEKGRISADAFVKILESSGPEMHSIPSALPVASLDGTLHDRFFDTEGAGVVRAKTGTLSHSRSLSGYITTRSGKRLTFAIIVDGYASGAAGGVIEAVDKAATALAALP
ncbi:MAG: D-alanyl-D-alanine carboxypeptidase/D-alanyl-D-alanine-endopeptidase [Actinomycetaceae bacterium]|nr:D-alanyl-D-alanine carboxypeptidase/D-alanyl-D-alanine-endopeptidase [Actinomycetaceae bacterium]